MTFARRLIYSHTASSRSAEHGPIITRNFSLFPVMTSATSLSLAAFNSTHSGVSGNSVAGIGIFYQYVLDEIYVKFHSQKEFSLQTAELRERRVTVCTGRE